MNLDRQPDKRRQSDTGKPCSIGEMAGVSFDSNGGDTPGIKSSNRRESSSNEHSCQSKPAHQPETLASPIDLLPKNQPIPEAFRLQMENDQKKEQMNTHSYENVSCKLEKQMKQIYVSDPKKLAEIEAADRDFKAPTDRKERDNDYPTSDFEKVKAIEEFDRKNMSEDRSTGNDPVESVYASDPKKLALIEGQDEVLRNASGAESHVYENVQQAVTAPDKKDCDQARSDSVDTEFADITGKAQKGDSSMMDLFKKFDDLKQDDQLEYGSPEEYYDYGEGFEWDIDFEHNNSETSTITESIDNDLDSCQLSGDALFIGESQVMCKKSLQPSPEMQDRPQTVEENLEEHQRRLARYTELTGYSRTGSGEQTPDETIVSQSGNVNACLPKAREPTEHDQE